MVDSGILQRVRRSLISIGRVPSLSGLEGPVSIVAGYSGGADSAALIAVLGELERLGLLQLTAVHVDHGVRADTSAEIETATRTATSLGVAIQSVAIEPPALALHKGVGLEEAMRRERYRLLASIAAEVGAPVIATGHHRGDQAETVLMHLLRGSGLRGASGMRELSEIVIPWWRGQPDQDRLLLWRPLLGESAASLRSLVEARSLPIVEDPSNHSDDFRRNALRHRALPLLEKIAPGAEANLAGFAERAADDDDALDTIAQGALDGISDRLERSRLLRNPLAVQRRILRTWVLAIAPGLELSFDRTEAIRTMAERNEGGKIVEIGAGWRVQLRSGSLVMLGLSETD